MSTPTPRKRLPVNPSIEHLKKQAKRLAAGNPSTQLADAQHQLARDYGCKNWAELAHVVETMNRGATQLANVKYEMEPLPAAANRNDLAEVRRILKTESFTQHDLDLALARVVLRFDEARRELAELLIEHGADPDGQYGSNYGPIVLVTAESVNPDGLQFMIDHGADVAFAPIDSKYGLASPMIGILSTYARGRNDQKHRYLDTLVEHGAAVPAETTPLFLSIHRGQVDELRRFLDGDPSLVHRRFPEMPYGNISLAGATLLHMAVEFGEIECVDLLLSLGANINARAERTDGVGGQTPIFHAIASPIPGGNLRTLEHVLDRTGQWIDMGARARVARFGKAQPTEQTPLEYAESIIEDKAHAELQLLRRMTGPRIDDPAFRGAVAAIDAGDIESLRSLLHAHPELATKRAEESGSFAGPYFARPALLWFVAENPIRTGKLANNICELAEAIIDAGASAADIDYTLGLVCSGRVARESGLQVPLIETLVQRGADPSKALPAAVQENEQPSIEALLRLGAKPDLPSAAGLGRVAELRDHLKVGWVQPPLLARAVQNAAARGQADALAALLDHGTDPNLRLGDGATALHQAAWFGHRDVIELLLSRGADPTIRDERFNATPAAWAQHNGHVQLAQKLRNAEAARA